MELIFSMLPVYLLGNLHCMGMCGPLAMLLAKHPFRMAYFLGRISSFTLVGMLVGEMGAGLSVVLHKFYIPAVTSLLFGLLILMIALNYIFSFSLPRWQWMISIFSKLHQKLSLLMLKQSFSAVYCFGLATVLLPCGQSLMIFSLSALLASPELGGLNALVFALITTPSLLFSMKASKLFQTFLKNYRWIMGSMLLVIACLALLRGLADLQVIEHFSLSGSDSAYHIILYGIFIIYH